MSDAAHTPAIDSPQPHRYGGRIVLFLGGMALLNLSVLLVAAGTWRWWNAWALVGFMVFWQTVTVVILARRNPELLNERAKFVKKDTQPFDKPILAGYFLCGFLLLATAGIDAGRFGPSTVPLGLTIAAFAVSPLVFAWVIWAMLTNTHFEATVRLQSDRGHQVISSGPYQFVRHPGYVGSLAGMAMFPLILGSWWAYIPAGLAASLMVLRTTLEDRMLRRDLPGYADYAERVRYRLLPGIW